MNAPNELHIGDTWSWVESLSDYSASTWTLTFYFVNASNTITAVATASGDDHSVSVAAATTATYTAGRYRWTARVTDGSTVKVVSQGWTEVKADPTTAQDARSHARVLLDAVKATLEGRATTDQQTMALNGRSISRIPITELREWRDELEGQVAEEELGDSAGLGRDLRVRFQRV